MSEQFRVLVTRRIAPEALAMLREQCAVTHWDSSEPIPRDRLLVDVANAEGLLALLTERVGCGTAGRGAPTQNRGEYGSRL